IPMVNEMKTLMQRGKEVHEQINILGDDGVPLEYHLTFWKSEVIDFVILQQDAFDAIDAVCPIERQQYMLKLVMSVVRADYRFDDFTQVMDYFKRLINALRQMNYSEFQSESFHKHENELESILNERVIR
ncbi:MAG: V-type ATP synthase subunit A, partial [Bacteroidales bacterium]|nr:V-type ATP synthase subunit A [Bacteroidales bacterium]